MDKIKTRKNKRPKYAESEDEDSEYEIESEYEESEHDIKTDKKKTPKTTNTKKKINKIIICDEDEDDFVRKELSYDEDVMSEDSIDDINEIKMSLGKKRKRSLKQGKDETKLKRLTVKKKLVSKKGGISKENKENDGNIEKIIKIAKKDLPLLDPNFNLEENYFYQDLPKSQWDQIKNFIMVYLNECKEDKIILKVFFDNYSKLKRGEHNIQKLKKMYVLIIIFTF